MFRKILYPVDFSKNSEIILRSLDELKRIGVNEIVLTHIIEYDPVGLLEAGIKIEEYVTKFKNKAEKKLSQFASVLEENFKVKLLSPMPSVNPADEIVKIANAEDVSLILLGSKSNILKSALMGSVSEGVVREAKKPVLVFKTKSNANEEQYRKILRRIFDKIVYPHDLSELSQEIIESVKNTSLLGNREVVIVHVVGMDEIIDKKAIKDEVLHPLVPIPNLVEVLSEYWIEAREYLNEIKKYFVGAGINAEVVLRVGSPSKEIPKIANMVEGSVIMINGKKGLTPNVDSIIRHSSIPVIVYRSQH